jgi:K(+)-stimulated pyrophosphate-energized sodium pump
MDTFGPVSDNAQGIAEMSGDVQGEAASVLERLDAVGNTTKAITKGIAIATAVLAATALFGSFRTTVIAALGDASASAKDAIGAEFLDFNLSIASPNVLIGMIVGAAVVFLFSGLAIMAVGRAAGRVVEEVRNQFRTKPGIMDYTEQPDYDRVVDICTRDAQRELATPGLLAIMAPIAVGFAFGYAPLGAYLGGAIAAGVLMAVFLSNSGGAWDNAKKLVEEGHLGGKGSDAHEATIIGDTVGDPFKDTAGPAINPLIKVMNLVALLIADAVVTYAGNMVLRVVVTVVSVGVIVAAIVISKRRADPIAEAAADPAVKDGEPGKAAVDGGADEAVEAPEEAAVGADSGGAATAEEESTKKG